MPKKTKASKAKLEIFKTKDGKFKTVQMKGKKKVETIVARDEIIKIAKKNKLTLQSE